MWKKESEGYGVRKDGKLIAYIHKTADGWELEKFVHSNQINALNAHLLALIGTYGTLAEAKRAYEIERHHNETT